MNDKSANPTATKPLSVRQRVKASVAKSIEEHSAARAQRKAEAAQAAAHAEAAKAAQPAPVAAGDAPAPASDQPAPFASAKTRQGNTGTAAQE